MPLSSVEVPTRHLQLPCGGTLAYSLYGDPAGRAVHFFHGFPSSRLLAALVHEQAMAARICLVAADRPGFGESSRRPSRSLRDWCVAVTSLANHLDQAQIDIIGVSCGGAYALACAEGMPDRIRRIALVAGMGPMDLPEIRRAQMPALKVMFALSRLHPRLASPMFLLDRSLFRGDPERAVRVIARMLSPPDRAVLAADPELGRRFVASMAEAYRQGIDAAMHEAGLIARPRPYRLRDIRVPVHVLQGGVDRHVPEAMGAHLARSLPDAHWHLFPDEGHLSILTNRFGECVAALTGEHSPLGADPSLA